MKTFTPFPPAPLAYYHPICPALGRVVREYRTAAGLSLAALSRICHVSDECIRIIEAAGGTPTLDRVARITDGLGVPVEAVLARARELMPCHAGLRGCQM